MGKYEEITNARHILGLYEFATLKDIKNKYRELIKEWHPDLCKENQDLRKEKTIEIINAYKIIMSYCENYIFSFSKEEIDKYISTDEFWKNKFGDDPIWGNFNNDSSKG